jgi:hypothetical protein
MKMVVLVKCIVRVGVSMKTCVVGKIFTLQVSGVRRAYLDWFSIFEISFRGLHSWLFIPVADCYCPVSEFRRRRFPTVARRYYSSFIKLGRLNRSIQVILGPHT